MRDIYRNTSWLNLYQIAQMLAAIAKFWSLTRYTSRDPKDLPRRLKLAALCFRHRNGLSFLFERPTSVVATLFEERPEMIGILRWPYQCASWDAATRLERLIAHCDVVERLGAPFDLKPTERFVLARLNDIREDLTLIVDQPHWFMREGGLVINLFLGRVRVYSMAFSLSEREGQIHATIGAIQGRDIDGAAELYRQLTKQANGMRPRDFLFEIFCMLCSYLGISTVLAVANEDRHHQHPFFGLSPKQPDSSNYNQIWEERGGTRESHSFYRLDVRERRRSIDEIPQKKRSMYRKRYEMLDSIRSEIFKNLGSLRVSPVYAPHEQFDL